MERLIDTIEQWQESQPTGPVVKAMLRLGDLGAVEATPVLVRTIGFYPRPAKKTDEWAVAKIDSGSRVPRLTQRHPAVLALRKIGAGAVPEITRRLGEVDGKADFKTAYLLRQTLLGILDRERAREHLKSAAAKAADPKARALLEKSAEAVRWGVIEE